MQPDLLEKANYVGNKRRLAKYIVGKFPDGGKTIFDPMAGCSAVLIEAARRGYTVQGNDLSIVPYWYSKGVFEGAALADADVERLVDSSPHEGWLTREWKGVYPRPGEVRRYLDGLALHARRWRDAKGLAARAIASRVLQTLYSDSISGYSTRRYEMLAKITALQKRLIAKTEEAVEQDVIIQQKEKNLNELRQIMKRQPQIEQAKMLSILKSSIRDKTNKMKAMAAELNMYHAQVSDYGSHHRSMSSNTISRT